jgi:hypothetical protein
VRQWRIAASSAITIGGEVVMPVKPTYPGVYVEELPSGAHPITGVATSITAFVDFFRQGPLGEAVHVFGWPDFERQLGGLDIRSEASYAVQQFFLGADAFVVRATSSTAGNEATAAAIALMDKSGGTSVLIATEANPGQWGNSLRIDVDYGTTDPTTLFNLTPTDTARSVGEQVAAAQTDAKLKLLKSLHSDAAGSIPELARKNLGDYLGCAQGHAGETGCDREWPCADAAGSREFSQAGPAAVGTPRWRAARHHAATAFLRRSIDAATARSAAAGIGRSEPGAARDA